MVMQNGHYLELKIKLVPLVYSFFNMEAMKH